MQWVEHVARMRELKITHKILVGKPEGKKQTTGRPKRRWDLKETEYEGVD
jgi:hypothetical protein